MSKFKELWDSAKKYILIVVIAILTWHVCANCKEVFASVDRVLKILSPVFAGVVIAFLANMPMRFLENRVFARWQKRTSAKRVVCMLLAILFVLAIIATTVLLIIPKLIESIRSLVDNFDTYIGSLAEWGDGVWRKLNFNAETTARVSAAIQNLLAKLDDIIVTAVKSALLMTMNVAAGVVKGLVAMILSVYVLFNKEKLMRQLKKLACAIFSQKHAERILEVCSRTNLVLNKYILGMVLECSILGIMCYIGMKIFGIPYAPLVSVMVGVTQMAPIIGPWCATIIASLIIFIVDPTKVLWFVLMIIIVQQLEEQIFYPRVVGNAVGLSGMWVIVAVLLGGGLFGIPGVILAVPIMAVIYTLASEWVTKRIEEKKRTT
ncbi:MAG: AI-2E family transporter [Clostridia bacterium]